jgi:uncharacterized protein
MNAQTERLTLQGPAGAMEVLLDRPDAVSCGHAVIAHPHPLFGGTMDNKVVQTLARAFVQNGWTSMRFNFRGVGASQGQHDNGRGETQDMLHLVSQLAPEGPLALAGFSFGAYVTSHAIASLHPQRHIEKAVLVGTAASRFDVAPIPAELHHRTLVIHGEADDTVPLASAMDWARPQALPILVVPGGSHFFHGQLPQLKSWVSRHLSAHD